ncbi:O-antigen ligase family protein [Pollutimonas thiosulfatoxidans]|nr:O-antigen ligase family protein [Pollutimonas thiosulfatoxidans]
MNNLKFAMLLCGFLCGIFASFVSGTRGGWLAVPLVLVLFCTSLLPKMAVRQKITGVLIVLVGLGGTFGVLRDDLYARYDTTVTELQQYVEGDRSATSIGLRLEAWSVAAAHIAQRPILGWGHEEYINSVEALTQEGEIGRSVGGLSNTHNNYLEVWLHQGVFGLAMLIALYSLPFFYFCKRLGSDRRNVMALAISGASVVASFAVFSLTQVILGRNNGVIFYLLSVALLWGCMRNEEGRVWSDGDPKGGLITGIDELPS